MRDGGLGEVEEGDELADTDLPGMAAQDVDELHADRFPERLGDRRHPLSVGSLDVGVGDRFAAGLARGPLLLRGELQIDRHLSTYINSSGTYQCNIQFRMSKPSLPRRCFAEGIGAFVLVFAGCGAIVANAEGAALGSTGVALAFGLVIMVMVYATGHLSGAHLNPAVTIAFTLTRHFPPREAALYVAAQCAGAVAAALALLAVWPSQPAQLGATLPSVGAGSALVYEGLLTAMLMFVIVAVATDTRAVGAAAAIAIGGTIGLDALVGGSITGASMNPARSLAPALVAGEWRDFWIYAIGPVLGAAIGAFAYQGVRGGAVTLVAGEEAEAA
jgi:aquaporin NIP